MTMNTNKNEFLTWSTGINSVTPGEWTSQIMYQKKTRELMATQEELTAADVSKTEDKGTVQCCQGPEDRD